MNASYDRDLGPELNIEKFTNKRELESCNASHAGALSQRGSAVSVAVDAAAARTRHEVCFPGLLLESNPRNGSGYRKSKTAIVPHLALRHRSEQMVPEPRTATVRTSAADTAEWSSLEQGATLDPGVIRLNEKSGNSVLHISRVDVQPMASVLELCSRQNVAVYACAPFAQVAITDFVDSIIYLGVVAGPVYFRHCVRCRVRIAAAQQVRIVGCADMHLQLRCVTCPVMETSKRVEFEDILPESEDAYPEESGDLALFRKHMCLSSTSWIDLRAQPPVVLDVALTPQEHRADKTTEPEPQP